ncbi:MAG: hypothetical protein ABR968_04625 [Bacteroidales bacterium]|jgi:hypothetical protein
MKEILKMIPVALYIIVGVISLLMAYKNLFAVKFLPFHQKASGRQWNEIEYPLKLVIISLIRLAGLGFLVIAILLLVFPVVNYFEPNTFYKYTIPVIALIYCSGLFIINYVLYSKTKAKTPWKGSLYAMFIIILGIIISIFS